MTQPAIAIAVDGTPLLEVHGDGRIAWSENQVTGGPPVHQSRIDPALVERVLSEIAASDLVGGRWAGDIRTGPDTRRTSIIVRDGDEVIVDVASWHELFEANPGLVVTSAGVQPLGGRTREAVLAQQPDDYRRFRRRWDYVAGRLRSLIPAQPE